MKISFSSPARPADAPVSGAEAARWLEVVATAEACDTASGAPPHPATVNARAAAEAARDGRRT